jgi:hypothetical protein
MKRGLNRILAIETCALEMPVSEDVKTCPDERGLKRGETPTDDYLDSLHQP